MSTVAGRKNLSINEVLTLADLIVLAQVQKEVVTKEGEYEDTSLEIHISKVFKGHELNLDLKKSITVLQEEDIKRRTDWNHRDRDKRRYTGVFWNYYKSDAKPFKHTKNTDYIFFLRLSSGKYDQINKQHFFPVARNSFESADFIPKLLKLIKGEN